MTERGGPAPEALVGGWTERLHTVQRVDPGPERGEHGREEEDRGGAGEQRDGDPGVGEGAQEADREDEEHGEGAGDGQGAPEERPPGACPRCGGPRTRRRGRRPSSSRNRETMKRL